MLDRTPLALHHRGGERLYRTGDLARWRADGSLDFLGRLDHQVKVRGQRIELGEIESALGALPEVREAAVVAYEAGGDSGDLRLISFLVAAAGCELESSELRAALGRRLPEPMVPAAFVVVDELPLNPNGKVDRKALTAQARSAASRATAGAARPYVAPRGEVEEVLAAMWSEVLGVERVGVEDDFFELGGHSILAMRLLARLEETFRFELPLKSLFQATTVERLAEALEAREPAPGRCAKVARVLLKVKALSAEEMEARLRS